MKLSIIIPCLNLENYISKLLDSLTMQTFKDFKIICVLDDCTDNTEQVINSYKNKLTIEIYKGSWHRAGLARNFGIEKADTDWIWFMDGDDWIIKDSLFEDVFKIINENPELEAVRVKNSKSSDCEKGYYIQCIWNWIINRNSLNKYNLRFPNLQVGEDCQLSCQINMILKNYIWDNDEPYFYYNYPREDSTRSKLEHKSNIYCIYPSIDATEFCKKHSNWVYIKAIDKTKILDIIKSKKVLVEAQVEIIDFLYKNNLPVNLIIPSRNDDSELYSKLIHAKNDVFFRVKETETLEEVLGLQFCPGSLGYLNNTKEN